MTEAAATTAPPTEKAPQRRALRPEQAAKADKLVAEARAGAPPPPPSPAPPSPEAKRGRGRPKGATTGSVSKRDEAELRKGHERAARACWLPVFRLAEKFGAEPATDDDMATIVDATVPMYEKYGGPPIELLFLGAVATVLLPRAATVATVIYVKHKARQAGSELSTKDAGELVRTMAAQAAEQAGVTP